MGAACDDQLRIGAPRYSYTVRAGVLKAASAKIGFEKGRIGTVNIHIAGEITVAGIAVGTGALESTPAEIELEGCCIAAIHIRVAVEIALAFTGIPAAVAARRGIAVCLEWIGNGGAVVTSVTRTIPVTVLLSGIGDSGAVVARISQAVAVGIILIYAAYPPVSAMGVN